MIWEREVKVRITEGKECSMFPQILEHMWHRLWHYDYACLAGTILKQWLNATYFFSQTHLHNYQFLLYSISHCFKSNYFFFLTWHMFVDFTTARNCQMWWILVKFELCINQEIDIYYKFNLSPYFTLKPSTTSYLCYLWFFSLHYLTNQRNLSPSLNSHCFTYFLNYHSKAFWKDFKYAHLWIQTHKQDKLFNAYEIKIHTLIFLYKG